MILFFPNGTRVLHFQPHAVARGPAAGGGAAPSAILAIIAEHRASGHGRMNGSPIPKGLEEMRQSQCLTLSLLFLGPSSPGAAALDAQQAG